MTIDPNIILGVKNNPINLPDPMEQYGKSLTLKHLMLQGDQAERGIADENAVRDAYKQAGGDSKALRALLQSGGQYKQLQALDKLDLENKAKSAGIAKDEAATAKSKYDVHIDQIQRRSSILSTATDQASWDAARRAVALEDPEVGAKLPQQFDPALLKTRLAEGQTIVQKLTDERARQQQVEATRHNRASEGNAAGQLAVSRDRLAFDQAQPKGILDPERGLLVDPRTAEARPVTVAGQAVPGKLSESQKKELSSLESQKSQVSGALKAVSESPDAFGLTRGAATMAGSIPESIAGRFDSDAQRQARSYVFNVVSKVINERAGAAQSAQELARLRSFLPSETDGAAQIKSKLEGFQTYLDDSRAGYDRPQTGEPPKPKILQKPKIGDRQGGYLFKGGDPANPKSWEQL